MNKATTNGGARLRLSEKTLSDVRAGYLYSNGRLVLTHETTHPKAGTVEWVTIHQTTIRCDFTGRLVLSRAGTVRLALMATTIKASVVSTEHGSENTQRRGLALGSIGLTLGTRAYQDTVYIPVVDGLSSDWTYQPETGWTELEVPTRWAGYTVANAGELEAAS